MIIPTQDYILLTVEKKAEEKTQGGIYLPDKVSDTPQCGTVARNKIFVSGTPSTGAGAGGGLTMTEYTKGTKIYFRKWAGEPIGDYLLVHIKDIVAYEKTE